MNPLTQDPPGTDGADVPLRKPDDKPDSDDERILGADFLAGLYALKKTLMADLGAFEKDFFFKAALEGAKDLLSSRGFALPSRGTREALEQALGFLKRIKYGEFTVVSFDEAQRTAEIRCANAPEAIIFQKNKDLQRTPVCSYSAGVLSWIGRLVFDGDEADDSNIVAFETQCLAQGNRECMFIIAPLDYLKKNYPTFSPLGESSDHELRLNEEILSKNLELQAINLTLERQIRRKTEEVWRSEENYRSLMNLVPDPVAIIMPNGRIIVANTAGANLFGVDLERETTETNITSMLSDKAVWDKVVWLLEKEGEVTDFEFDLERTDGRRMTLRMSARFADLIPGKCVEAVFQDMTDRRLMEQQVIEAKSESEFFNDLLSHDIMNYAFSALHFLDMVWKSRSLTDEDRRYLAMVTKDLQGAFELSTSVRDLARLKTIKDQDLVIKDLKLLILEAIEDSKRLFSDRKIRINFERDTEPRYVKCSSLTNRAMSNLLTNAVKFNPAQEAAVDITAEPFNENGVTYWQINVMDYGKGIPDEEKEQIFERFHRLDPSVKGTGLGLYVAKTIVEASGGQMWAKDRIKGDFSKGARMVVLLRKADEKEVARNMKKQLAEV